MADRSTRSGQEGAATHAIRISLAVALWIGLAVGTAGCFSGAIYTHTTMPLDLDFDETAQQPGHRGTSWKTLVIPAYIVNPQFDWGSIAIADALAHAEIESVHYADLETLSIMGVWTQRTIRVYGE